MQTGTSRLTTDSNQRPAQATECLELRFKDLDFNTNQILVRDGKGQKDRITTLPASVKEPLLAHLRDVWRLHQKELREGAGRVSLRYALARKYSNADREWGWQWAFPLLDIRIGQFSVEFTFGDRADRSAYAHLGASA